MKLLLDTHIVLWAIIDNPKLTKKAKALIEECTMHYQTILAEAQENQALARCGAFWYDY